MLNHTRILKRSLAAGLVIAAAAFPPLAQASIGLAPGENPNLSVARPVTAQPSTFSTQTSFDWGDAGIGAAGAVVLLGAGAVGVSATRRRGRPAVG